MLNIGAEFEKYNQRVKDEEQKYANTEVKIENYNFPHIYLSDGEIEEFNSLCDKLGVDLKVVPITDYMNLNSPEKNPNENKDEDDDEESEYARMERVDKVMNYLGTHFLPDMDKNKLIMDKDEDFIMNEVNNYIGKKQQRNFFEHTHMSTQKNNENNELSNLSENNKGKKSITRKKRQNKTDEEIDNDYLMKDSEKKISKKKNICKNDSNLQENFNFFFKKITDTVQEQENDKKRKAPLINEILEKSQLLTPEDLQELAKKKHISVINDINLSENDLKKRDVRKLDDILVDINFNSNVSKLKNEKRENIKKIKQRKNLVNQSILAYMENKKMKEQKKLKNTQATSKEKSNNNNMNSDIDSDSDDESI